MSLTAAMNNITDDNIDDALGSNMGDENYNDDNDISNIAAIMYQFSIPLFIFCGFLLLGCCRQNDEDHHGRYVATILRRNMIRQREEEMWLSSSSTDEYLPTDFQRRQQTFLKQFLINHFQRHYKILQVKADDVVQDTATDAYTWVEQKDDTNEKDMISSQDQRAVVIYVNRIQNDEVDNDIGTRGESDSNTLHHHDDDDDESIGNDIERGASAVSSTPNASSSTTFVSPQSPQSPTEPLPLIRKNNLDNDCCAICLDCYHNGDIVMESTNKSCQHYFHRDCIIHFLTTSFLQKRKSHLSLSTIETDETILSSGTSSFFDLSFGSDEENDDDDQSNENHQQLDEDPDDGDADDRIDIELGNSSLNHDSDDDSTRPTSSDTMNCHNHDNDDGHQQQQQTSQDDSCRSNNCNMVSNLMQCPCCRQPFCDFSRREQDELHKEMILTPTILLATMMQSSSHNIL